MKTMQTYKLDSLAASLFAAVLALAAVSAAQAALITSPNPGALQITFDDSASYDTSGSSVQIGNSISQNVLVSAAGGTLNFGAPIGAWSLADNGEWTGASFVGVDGDFQNEPQGIAASLFFDLGSPAFSVGAVMNFDPTFTYGGGLPLPLYIAVFDSAGTLLEDHFVPVATPNAINQGLFYGITLATPSIARFEVSGPFAVLDNLSVTPVPEPGTGVLVLAAMGALGAATRRRSQA